jgi:5-methylcytosine-specific restriction endonuclease McrBC GTP-binding regulatory subunit McrB
MPNIDEITDLLLNNKNIILHGAPGTGKTYMARNQIIDKLEKETKKICNVEFVQFHQSYDYTDFVEGLRPSNEENKFERQDGIFKNFCKRAQQNFVNSKKTKDELKKEIDDEEFLNVFLQKCEDEEKKFEKKHKNGRFPNFKIEMLDNLYCKPFIVTKSEKRYLGEKINKFELLKVFESDKIVKNPKEVSKILSRKNGFQKDSYIFPIVELMRNEEQEIRKLLKDNNNDDDNIKTNEENFVFIIDEINRGEVSRIFGELFFSIEPSYRGEKKSSVITQYQNLLDDSDEFINGFFIPENVYIIGTMNDIDRSVESFDFAMRRRFTWIEITADESFKNINNLDTNLTEKLKNLNESIKKELGTSYQIGAGYINGKTNADEVWKYNIEPLLKEYVRGKRDEKILLEEFEKSWK